MKCLKFLCLNPKLGWTWKLHKIALQMNIYQCTKFSASSQLYFGQPTYFSYGTQDVSHPKLL